MLELHHDNEKLIKSKGLKDCHVCIPRFLENFGGIVKILMFGRWWEILEIYGS